MELVKAKYGLFICTAFIFIHGTHMLTDEERLYEYVAKLNETRQNEFGILAKQINNSISESSSSSPPTTSQQPGRCSCVNGQCGCCTGSILESFNQKACLNITYEPDDFAFTAAVSLNGVEFYKNRVSGKNPPPLCIRLPRIRAIRVCMKLSNVYFSGPNMHTCVAMQANFEDFQLFDVSLDCIRLGANGFAVVGPEEGGGIGSVVEEEESIEDYDDSARELTDISNESDTIYVT